MKQTTNIEQIQFQADIYGVPQESCPVSFPTHWHQFVECVALVEQDKTAVISVNNTPITLAYGDILFIWPGELHKIVDNFKRAIIVLQFPLALLNEKREFATCHTLYRQHPFLPYIHNSELNNALLKEIHKILELSHRFSTPFRNIRMTISLYEIFMKLASAISNMDNVPLYSSGISNGQMEDKISLACSYITEHCTETITLAEVAAYVGFSESYFSRHFKAMTSHSFVEFLNIQRVNRLQILLSDKTLTITEAAYLAGFSCSSTVNRVFAKYCGCSPSKFRGLQQDISANR